MATEVIKVTLVDTNPRQATTGDSGIVQEAFRTAGFDSTIRLLPPEASVEFTDKRPSPAEAGEIFSAVKGRLTHTQSASLETVQTETMALRI
jgi:hypothetical protein